MIELAYRALDLLLAAFGGLRRVKVFTYVATRVSNSETSYFVKVVNLSRDRDIEVTHVWLAAEPNIPIINHDRPLPVRLRPDETWETWLPLRAMPINLVTEVDTVVRLARVRLSNGSIIRAHLNQSLAVGYLAGGPVTVGCPRETPPAPAALSEGSEPSPSFRDVTTSVDFADLLSIITEGFFPNKLSLEEESVLKMFSESGDSRSIDDVMNRFHLSVYRAAHLLRRLQELGVIMQVGKSLKRKRHYVLTDIGRRILTTPDSL